MIPWLGLQDQELVLPESQRYNSEEEQGAYIREWLGEAGMTAEADDLRLVWYDARYHPVGALVCAEHLFSERTRARELIDRQEGGFQVLV